MIIEFDGYHFNQIVYGKKCLTRSIGDISRNPSDF